MQTILERALTTDLVEEVNLLGQFDLSSLQAGIKIHSSADQSDIDAAKRLFDKGLITLVDGGYLTDRGHEAAEHLQHLTGLLGLSAAES